MKTVSEVLSIFLGFFGLLFLVTAVAVRAATLNLSSYLFLLFHLVLVFAALPLVVRALFILDEVSFDYQLIIGVFAVANSILIFVLRTIDSTIEPLFVLAAFAELLPILLIVLRSYVKLLDDATYLVYYELPYIY